MRRFSRSHKRFRRRASPLFWILPAAVALIILVLRLTFFHTVRIEGSSMENSLRSGDIALVTCMTGEPQRGDILECRFPGRSGTYVKRLIGLPGEHVEIKNGITYVNDQAVPEPYLTSYPEAYSVLLNEDEYLVLGDNRAESYDSREEDMGPISKEDIIGRVRFVLWPPRSIN